MKTVSKRADQVILDAIIAGLRQNLVLQQKGLVVLKKKISGVIYWISVDNHSAGASKTCK